LVAALQDPLLPGVTPSGVPSGEGQKPSERTLGRTPAIETDAGRDRVSVSPLAREAAARQALEAAEGRGNEAATGEAQASGSENPLKGFIHKALNVLRADVGKLLKGFGFGAEEIKGFGQSFVEPALNALKEGVSFTAELSYAAFSQETVTTSNSFSQSTSLVAKSLEIEVNQTTGEVSVTLASLTYQEEIRVVSADADVGGPLLSLFPDETGGPLVPAREPSEEETPVEQAIRQAAESLNEDISAFRSRLVLRALEFYQNGAGDDIARLRLDAEVPVSGTVVENEAGKDATETENTAIDVSV